MPKGFYKHKERPINEREKRFAAEWLKNAFCGRSYKAAGYKVKNDNCATAAGYRLLRKDKIQIEITRLRAEKKVIDDKNAVKVEVTKERIVADLDEIKQLCLKKKDYSTAATCIIWQGKTEGLFSDNLNTTDLVRQAELEAEEAAELQRINHIRMQDILAGTKKAE